MHLDDDSNPFREIVRERLAKLLASSGLENIALGAEHTLIDGLLEVADSLKAYQEEGVDLRPEFLIFREEDYRQLRNSTEVSHFFELCHRKPLALRGFRDAVKHCAPLAQGVWAAFVKLRQGSLSYGVVRRRNSVISERVFSHPTQSDTKPPPFVRIRQVVRHMVEVQSPHDVIQVSFSLANANVPEDAHAARMKLLDALTKKTFRSKKAHVRAVLEEALDRALSHGRGFLVGIAPCGDSSLDYPELHESLREHTRGLFFHKFLIPTQLKVSELLKWRFKGNSEEQEQVLDFLEGHGEYPANLTAFGERLTYTYAEVEAWSQLISSMLLTDGATLFDDRGNVLGFRIFIQNQTNRESDGGARKLAFESMKDLVRERALIGAYYQSQDGNAIFYP